MQSRRRSNSPHASRRRATGRAVFATAALLPAAAGALEVLPNEKAGRDACQKRACDIILKKADGPPLVCDMVKTWDRDKIKKGGEKKRLTWGFGDARCSLALKLDRALILPALQNEKYTLVFPPQKITCVVEGVEDKTARPLVVTAAPKVKFKNGEAYKVWLNVTDIEGEGAVKNLVWSVTQLADGIGIFHSATLAGINKFVHETCPAEHAEQIAKSPAAKSPAAANSPATRTEPAKAAAIRSDAGRAATAKQERATAD